LKTAKNLDRNRNRFGFNGMSPCSRKKTPGRDAPEVWQKGNDPPT